MQNQKKKNELAENIGDESIQTGVLFENQRLGLLTIEQVADALGKAPGTVRNMIARREIPFIRVGNKNMIRKASFEAWLQRKEFLPWE